MPDIDSAKTFIYDWCLTVLLMLSLKCKFDQFNSYPNLECIVDKVIYH